MTDSLSARRRRILSEVRAFAIEAEAVKEFIAGVTPLPVSGKVLDPDDYDVPDPYGQSLSVYQMTADAIREALELRAKTWNFIP